MPTIYDVGMHNGDDTEYYLTKGYDVVAVEANPDLCMAAEKRFSTEVLSGRLKIINSAIAEQNGSIRFYIHREESEWSSIVEPEDMTKWRAETVSARTLSSVIANPEDVAFIKIDIEGADLIALESLAGDGIMPKQISCEAHSPKILCKLILMGYNQFRLLNGKTSRKKFRRHKIRRLDGAAIKYSFSRNSSGPFGEDLPGEWYNTDQILYLWAGRSTLYGHGWFDVHASIADQPALSHGLQ